MAQKAHKLHKIASDTLWQAANAPKRSEMLANFWEI